MHLVRCMLITMRQGAVALCGCLCAGLLAPQAGAQAGIAGSLNRGGPWFASPAWSVSGDVTRSDLGGLRWGCHPGWGACLVGTELRLIRERQRRFEALRNEPPASQAPVAGGLWRAPPVTYLPPPTPPDQILPAYRERSILRPEFQDSGVSRD